MKKLSNYERVLLDGWEDVYKKAQVTMWLLLALRQGEKHMAEIKAFISHMTNDLLTPDDKSMYRALRRLTAGDITTFREVPAKAGPDYKVYSLTAEGMNVLEHFLKRNITDVYYDPKTTVIIRGK